MGDSKDVGRGVRDGDDLEAGRGAPKGLIRKAKVGDAQRIQELINTYAERGLLLPRSLGEIYDNLRDYFVYERGGGIIGVCALHVCWEDLAEIRSLVVEEGQRRKGIGGSLVEACLREAKDLGVKRVFLLTYHPRYFERFGFRVVNKEILPQKIWNECLKCPKFPKCDEVAMLLWIGNEGP